MKRLILFLSIMPINSCLESMLYEKTEMFNIDCNGILIETLIEKSKNQCNAELFT